MVISCFTNFDLSQHAKYSGRKIEYFDPETNESYTPYVIETSIGVDRMFLSVMCHSYEEEKLDNGETRVVLRLPAALGFGSENYRYHDHEKLAHYANAATDIEFLMPFGFKEVEGIHSRTNFDLSQQSH